MTSIGGRVGTGSPAFFAAAPTAPLGLRVLPAPSALRRLLVPAVASALELLTVVGAAPLASLRALGYTVKSSDEKG